MDLIGEAEIRIGVQELKIEEEKDERKGELFSCFSSLFHRSSSLPAPFAGLQRCVRSCSEVIAVVWIYSAEKPRRLSIVFEVVKKAGWKRVVVDRVSLNAELLHRMLSIKVPDEGVNIMMVVLIVSTSATPFEAAIAGAALKVMVQAMVGVGLWSKGYLVHLRASCFACSVLEVQPVTIDSIRFFRDVVDEWYWFCQSYLILSIIFTCQGLSPTLIFVLLYTHGISQQSPSVANNEKLKGGSSQGDYIWNVFGDQPLEDKLEMSFFYNVIMNTDDKKADDLSVDHPQAA
ncbi:hypothetical protein V6N13_023581 [Hibiscus sabdariffa]|uniref:Uncharacterized protein n=1 Tax=Hibiscus sabdariffa TaxID=183260 RepID=A0ABR2PMG9_9ROSI